MPGPPADPLDAPLTILSGVAAERAEQLARLRLHTVRDLLLLDPRRHEDRRVSRPIAQLRLGESATARGKIVAQGIKRWKAGSKSVFEFILDDGTAQLHCRWWNLPFMEKYFQTGDEVFVHGRVNSQKPRSIDHPETEIVEDGAENFIHLNRVVPIYPLTEGLPQRWLRGLAWRALERYGTRITDPWHGWICRQGRPDGLRTRASKPSAPGGTPGIPPPAAPPGFLPTAAGTEAWLSRAEAVRLLHFPDEMSQVGAARRRLALDEFLELQIDIRRRRRRFQASAKGLPCAGDNHLIRPFLKRLGFVLTEPQTKVLREIRRDLGGAQPMRRLLQGDVGSGKTVVAACAALMTIESGFNVALMAPTEVLAEQHLQTFSEWFGSLGIAVELRTGSGRTSNIEHRTSNIQQPGTPHAPPATRNGLFIGTHALIMARSDVPDLGLAVIDEQHKFGVAQREQLVRKGRYPHLLVMTATPIPRTLALTLYGDLDVSVIERGPPGRGRLKTYVRAADTLPKVFEFIRDKLKEGRQAYVVYPRVEESNQAGIKTVTKEWEHLQKAFSPYPVGLLHGRLSAEEKQRVMSAFRANEIRVLVATSVIEVGVDVPNATVMLIENAEQFGLAQLHQLRGRIGRGAHESHCILVGDIKTDEARRRLKVLETTADGFRVAEADLELRGPGELLGREQSGLLAFRFGDLRRDRDLIERARQLAEQIVASEPSGAAGTLKKGND